MKDYSLNYEDSKTFILNYKIEDNQIIVNLACKKECIIPYSLVNEKELLKVWRCFTCNSLNILGIRRRQNIGI